MCVDDVFWEPRDCVFMYSLKNFVDDFFFHVLKSIENTPKIGKEVKEPQILVVVVDFFFQFIYLFFQHILEREERRGQKRQMGTKGSA